MRQTLGLVYGGNGPVQSVFPHLRPKAVRVVSRATVELIEIEHGRTFGLVRIVVTVLVEVAHLGLEIAHLGLEIQGQSGEIIAQVQSAISEIGI